MSEEITGKALTYVETDLDVYRITVFENEPIAAGLPRNWAAPNSANHTVSVVANANMPSGKALRLQKTSGNRSLLAWIAPPAIRDASAVGLFRTEAAGLTNMGIGLRWSGGDGTETGYACLFRSDVQVEIFKFVGGAPTSLAVGTFAHGENENLWLRFDAIDVSGGVLLRAKAWRGDADDEPEAFLASFTEVTTVLAAGNNGLASTTLNTPDSLCGLFRVRSLFSQATETLRFTKSAAYLPTDIDAIQSLLEVQVSPGAISLGENLGERATVTAAFKDHEHADLGELFSSGTFWGKFRGRQIFRRGEPIRVIRGLLGQTLGQMETRHFVLDSFNGPAFGGAFQLVGKDPLKLADDDRALAPRPSNGFLIADVLAAATTLTLSPGGIGDAEYPETGFAAIGGKEVVQFSRGGNDAFTKVLLHFNGVDASTTITDNNVGGAAHTWTAGGNAQIDTAQSKFGGASGLFDGTGDFVDTPDSADFALGSSNFTFDFWFNCTAATGNLARIAGQNDSGFTTASVSFSMFRQTTGEITVRVCDGTTFFGITSTTQFTNLVNPGWHHLAFVRTGNVLKLFVDGVQEGGNVAFSGAVTNSASRFTVGRQGEEVAGVDGTWKGWIDEFRLSVGIARWTTNFALPIGPYDLGNTMTIVRAQFGTVAIDHKAEDRVQLCLVYTAKTPSFIISDLFVNYAGIPQAYVPTAVWDVECDSFLDRLYTKVIADPEGVQKLVSRLIEQAGLAVWWDAVTQLIRLQVLRGVSTDAFLYDQSNVLVGSISVTEQPDKRITQVWTYYGVRNPLEPLDQQNNYRSGLVTVDLETETLHGGAVITTIYSDWIPAFGRQTAQRVNDLQIGRFKNPPRRVSFDTMRYSGVLDPELGGGYRFGYWGAQNEYGAQTFIPIQVTRLNPMVDRFVVEAEEMLFTQQAAADLINRVILFDSSINNVNLKSVHDSIYPILTDADVVAGVNLTVIVGTGVVIGSTSTSAAFDVSTGWPVGIPIVVQNMGVIAGRGGAGGRGHFQVGSFGGSPGLPGGLAFLTTVNISVDNIGGTIGGGGGGGGGGGTHNFSNDDDFPGGGGGGGAGETPGAGGLAGFEDRSDAGLSGSLLTGGTGGDGDGFGTANDGGNGGNLGASGGLGVGNMASTPGAAGVAVNGQSHITYINVGTILGATIN